MSVRFLDAPNFVGLRVRRHIDGVAHEAHFPFVLGRGAERRSLGKQELVQLRNKAEAYDAKLARLQNAAQKIRRNLALPSQRSNTSVRGITLGVSHDRYKDRKYVAPAFIVSCRDLSGKRVKKPFLLSVHGYQGHGRRR